MSHGGWPFAAADGLRVGAAAAPTGGDVEPAWCQQELEQAVRESLRKQPDPQPGEPLHGDDLQPFGLYFEAQHPSSDTCGLNALNNICQRPLFSLSDLQKAEAVHAQVQEGGTFGGAVSSASVWNAPRGFFDVEAVKLAAASADLEIVDVEPVVDFRRSRCFAFAQAASATATGSWFLGFLVYDRRPGQMHYYTLRRDERSPGVWFKLDSQLAAPGEEPKNRRMVEADLWSLYEASRMEFQAWLMRWYPVVHRAGAAKEVCKSLAADGCEVGEPRALRALRDCGWLVDATVEHLARELPQRAVRELLVKFARPSEAEMRSLLEAARWDVAAAQPAIDQVVRRRIALAQGADAGDAPRRALSACDWEPVAAATLLALQLQTGAPPSAFGELRSALQHARDDVDRAEAILKLRAAVGGNMPEAARLFEQIGAWSVPVAERVLQVWKRFPCVSVGVALEVLRRNDDDPHAAGEMLAEYENRVRRTVAQNASGDLFQGEEVPIAEAALNAADWDPSVAFVKAKAIAFAVQKTRKLLRGQGYKQFYAIKVLLPALIASELQPEVAASTLLTDQPPQAMPSQRLPPPGTSASAAPLQLQPPRRPPHAPETSRRPPAADEDDACVVM